MENTLDARVQGKPNYHWGHFLWAFIHTICIIDYMSELQTIKLKLENIVNIIPCEKCKLEYSNEINSNEFKMLDLTSDPLILFKWSVEFHNKVNTKLGKNIIFLEEAIKIWTTLQS
jgi:hypothetical protein